jgi:hypothetical protein
MIIVGFYIYIISFILMIFDNEDLKRRTFINCQLSRFISLDEEDKDHQKFDITCIMRYQVCRYQSSLLEQRASD